MPEIDYDAVYFDEYADCSDGAGWTFAPEDSAFAWRFPTREQAQAFADEFIAGREAN